MAAARPTHPYLDTHLPIAFAHRGGAVDVPENTMPAFESAVALGYRYIETDAHATRDGEVFAFHDDRLDRVTDGRGVISQLLASEVATAEAGHDWSPDNGATFPYRGEGLRIPRLSDLLEAFPDVRINIDVKSWHAVSPLARLLRRHAVLDRVCVGSFSDARLRTMRVLCGEGLCTSMGPRAVAMARIGSWGGRIRRARAQCLQIPVRDHGVVLCDRRLITAAHAAGLHVHVWTIDEPDEMERLLNLGVDGIMTDRPAVLRTVMERRGLWHNLPGPLASIFQ